MGEIANLCFTVYLELSVHTQLQDSHNAGFARCNHTFTGHGCQPTTTSIDQKNSTVGPTGLEDSFYIAEKVHPVPTKVFLQLSSYTAMLCSPFR